eukprot:s995_g28.t1
MICIGKIDPQDSFLLYNGENLILARSIRRIGTCWKGHLAFYLNFKCASYDFKSAIEPSKFFDEDAHAVRQKALEEQREDYEAASMAAHDRQRPAEEVEQPLQDFGAEVVDNSVGFFDDDIEEEQIDDQSHKRARVEDAKKARLMQIKAQYAGMVNAVTFDDGSEFHTMADYSQDLQMNDHEGDEDPWLQESLPIASTTTLRQPKTKWFALTQGDTVQYPEEGGFRIGVKPCASVRRFRAKKSDEDPWQDDPTTFTAMPAELWSEADLNSKPDDPPQHIDDLADEVEIARLCGMGVLQHASDFSAIAADEHRLTTKFVRDWRLKQFEPLDSKIEDGMEPTMKWLRRSRLVASG